MTAEELYRQCVDRLSPVLGGSEAKSAAKIIFEDVRGMTPTQLALYGYRELEDFTVEHISDIVSKIVNGLPVQYAIGTARFYGLDFVVNQSVLIPRPETQWLVDRIADDYRNIPDLSVLDCGTGSGCIAIALARTLNFAKVSAIDISDDALDVAKKNARRLNVSVDFHKTDILKLHGSDNAVYDIIVSNPPYIADDERSDMDARVLNYEPSMALFVPDSDPLIFYNAIAEYGLDALKPGGRLFFEINPLFADSLQRGLSGMGYENVELFRDYIGRTRYAIATLDSGRK